MLVLKTGMILNIQQIINVNISLGDSMTLNIIRVLVFGGASILINTYVNIAVSINIVISVSNSVSVRTNIKSDDL